MKMMKTCAVALAMLATVPAMAQFSGSSSSVSVENENYQRVTLGYNAVFASPKGGDGNTLSGFVAGYTYGLSVSENMPLYVDFGGRLSYNSGDNKTKLMGLTIPVNVAYKFHITDEWSVTPYTGINFRINLLGKMNGNNMFDLEGDVRSMVEDELGEEIPDEIWDQVKDQMGDELDALKDSEWKRFQMGWQIGAGVNFGPWYAGLEYGLDFIKLQKDISTSNFSFTVGYTF